MHVERAGHAIGASLIGLALLLTAPNTGAAQKTARSGVSADTALSYHLSARSSNSFFTRHGIWVRHDGMWAFRPTASRNWQEYFRCQVVHGCSGFGYGWYPYSFSSWLPYRYAGWGMVPGGWMWFPGQGFAGSRAWDLYWDLWFFTPRYGFGAYGFGRPFSLYGGLQRLAANPRAIPGHRWDLRQDVARLAERWNAQRPYQDRADARREASVPVDPVPVGARVEPLDVRNKPSRSAPKSRIKPGSIPSLGQRGEAAKRSPASSSAGRLESPRKPSGSSAIPKTTRQAKPKTLGSPRRPAAGSKATGRMNPRSAPARGQSKPKGKSTPKQ